MDAYINGNKLLTEKDLGSTNVDLTNLSNWLQTGGGADSNNKYQNYGHQDNRISKEISIEPNRDCKLTLKTLNEKTYYFNYFVVDSKYSILNHSSEWINSGSTSFVTPPDSEKLIVVIGAAFKFTTAEIKGSAKMNLKIDNKLIDVFEKIDNLQNQIINLKKVINMK